MNEMDLFTYHTLMMGHLRQAHYQPVLLLYKEALDSGVKVRLFILTEISSQKLTLLNF